MVHAAATYLSDASRYGSRSTPPWLSSFHTPTPSATDSSASPTLGTITGTSGNGIYAFNGSAQVTNSGLITSGNTGVSAASSVSLTNSGTVAGASGYGVYAAGDAATVINSGAITGGQQGVYAFKSASVTNSGTITGITGGIIANASAN